MRPAVVAFDVIETLFPLDPLRPKLESLGLPPQSLEVWFGSILRDAFALTVTGKYAPFELLATGGMEELLAETGRAATADDIKSVLGIMPELPPHPDVREAFETLRGAGVRIIALSNGSKAQTQKQLAHADLSDFVETIVSTDDVQLFKPHRAVYEHTAQIAGVDPSLVALVAAHGWDVHGAKCAGLTAGWVKRREKRFSKSFEHPDAGGESLPEVVRALLSLSG